MIPFLGLGTGRCGTKSLASIVGACGGTEVSHERYRMPWYKPHARVGELIVDLKEHQSRGVLRGEVNSCLLPRVESIREAIPDLRLVVLHRPREAVVESFVKFTGGRGHLRPPDKLSALRSFQEADQRHCFPVIDAHTNRQAWVLYWEMYEAWSYDLSAPVLHMQMDELNGDLVQLHDFLGVPESDRVLPVERRLNSFEEALKPREFKWREHVSV